MYQLAIQRIIDAIESEYTGTVTLRTGDARLALAQLTLAQDVLDQAARAKAAQVATDDWKQDARGARGFGGGAVVCRTCSRMNKGEPTACRVKPRHPA